MNNKLSIGIDIGGTNTVIGLVSGKGICLDTASFKTAQFDTAEKFISQLAKSLSELLDGASVERKDLLGIGIGAPNANYYTGTIEDAPNLPWKGRIELVKILSEISNFPQEKIILTNDANAAAIGEKVYGKAKDKDNFVVITLGTGVGSGFFVNGKLLYGSTGFAGEVGHLIVKEDGRHCNCGRCGCLETYCSASGIVRTVREFLPKYPDSLLNRIELEKITSKDIFLAAEQNDDAAIDIFNFTGEILGTALANVTAITSPSNIYLFGGLALAGDFIMKPTREAMTRNLLNIFKGTAELEISGLPNNEAAILGASALVSGTGGRL